MSIETFERELAEHPFFKDLQQPHLATLVGCVSNVKFEAGEFLFREGMPADRFYVVEHGQIVDELQQADLARRSEELKARLGI